MYKKILLPVVFSIVGLSVSYAQSFEFSHKTTTKTTEGTNADEAEELVIYNKLKNTSEEAFTFDWRFINYDVAKPIGWTLSGFCDNITCYVSGWQAGQVKTSGELAVGDSSDFKLQMRIPKGIADDGSVTFHFEAKTKTKTDTASFIVTKKSLGIDVIKVDDDRVNVYPNPTNDNKVNLYTALELKATKAFIYNHLGQLVQHKELTLNTEFHTINIETPGIYMISLINNENKHLTTKTLIKK